MNKLPGLNRQIAIVKEDGTPTDYFMRLLQQQGLLIDNGNAETGVVPGTYGAPDMSVIVTVDAQGRITNITETAISATFEVTGGILPVVDGSIPPTFIQTPDGGLVYTEIL